MADSLTVDDIKDSQQTGTVLNGAKPMSDAQYGNLKSVYDQLCISYRAIDDFRAKLLGLLPLASAGGIFLLLNQLPDGATSRLGPIGAFGSVVTLGLFAYEIFGIKKCHALIQAGQQIEGLLRVDGQFIHRPREVLGFINEPFAAGIIYPAVLAAWIFLGLVFVWPQEAWWIALVVFWVGSAGSVFYNARLKREAELTALTRLNQRILQAEEDGDEAALDLLLADDFTIVRSSGVKQDRQAFLDAVPANKHRGRRADHRQVCLDRDRAEFTCRVTTTRDKDGNTDVRRFWNTRQFIQEGEHWICTGWQVMEIHAP